MQPIDICADFTRGTKPMTLGMIMACLLVEKELQYVPYNPETKHMHGPYFITDEKYSFSFLNFFQFNPFQSNRIILVI